MRWIQPESKAQNAAMPGHREALQRRYRVEDALLRFEISAAAY